MMPIGRAYLCFNFNLNFNLNLKFPHWQATTVLPLPLVALALALALAVAEMILVVCLRLWQTHDAWLLLVVACASSSGNLKPYMMAACTLFVSAPDVAKSAMGQPA